MEGSGRGGFGPTALVEAGGRMLGGVWRHDVCVVCDL